MKYKFLIASILLTGISIIALSIVIGIRKRDIVVEDHPYDAGLVFDEKLKRYAELGWRVEVPHSIKAIDNELMVRILDKQDRPVESAIVEYIVNRCSDTHRVKYRTDYSGNGYYKTRLNLIDTSCIEIRVNVEKNRNVLSFDNTVYVER